MTIKNRQSSNPKLNQIKLLWPYKEKRNEVYGFITHLTGANQSKIQMYRELSESSEENTLNNIEFYVDEDNTAIVEDKTKSNIADRIERCTTVKEIEETKKILPMVIKGESLYLQACNNRIQKKIQQLQPQAQSTDILALLAPESVHKMESWIKGCQDTNKLQETLKISLKERRDTSSLNKGKLQNLEKWIQNTKIKIQQLLAKSTDIATLLKSASNPCDYNKDRGMSWNGRSSASRILDRIK